MDPPHKKFRPQSTHALLVAMLLLCLLSGTVLVWRTLLDDERQRSHQLLQQETDSLARQIETHFSYQTDALRRLALRWDHYHNQRALWEEDVDRLLVDFANLQAIEWLDSSYRVRWLRPLEGNEQVLGFHYQADHPNMPYLHQAQETGMPTLSSHFELLQSGHGLAYQIPMYRQVGGVRQFDGYLIAIFRVEHLIDSLLRQLPTTHMSLSLSNNQQPIFQRKRADTIDAPGSIKAAVQLGGNDTYGHLLGDDALRKVSHALQQHAGREGERVCRYGGEEFAILLPGADLPQCHKVAALIHEDIRGMHIPHQTESGRLTVSIGIACALPGCEQAPEALVSAADRALYHAKRSGRDRSAETELLG